MQRQRKRVFERSEVNWRATTRTVLLGLLCTCFLKVSAQTTDRVVAVVNDEAITLSEYGARHQFDFLGGRPGLGPYVGLVNDEVLAEMAQNRMIIQEALLRGIRIADVEVDRAIVSIARGNQRSVEEFLADIQADGIRERDFRDSVRNQLLRQRMVDFIINADIEVTDEEVEAFLSEQEIPVIEDESASYDLVHVLYPLDGLSETEIIERRAALAEAFSAAQSREDFEQTAVELSAQDPLYEGGNLGWRNAASLPEVFLEPLSTMQPGTVSRVVQSEHGLHVLFLADKRSALGDEVVKQENVSHILIRPGGRTGRTPEEAKELADQIYNRLEQGENFASLARIYSEDFSTAESGGELGWVDESVLPGALIAELSEMDIGAYSEPVQGAGGWHILYLNNRRHPSAQLVILQNRAKRILYQQKAATAFDEWLEPRLTRTFIEYRND